MPVPARVSLVSIYKWFPISNGKDKAGEARIWLEFTDLRMYFFEFVYGIYSLGEKTNKGPSNVQHHGHIGIVNGQFSADNLPKEWKEQLKQAGVRKKDLNNPELRDLLFGLILAEGGKLVDDLEQQPSPQQPNQPLPQPSTNPYQKTTPPTPQPRPPSLPQPNTNQSNSAILFNPGPSTGPTLPPPIQQQSTPFIPSGSDEPMMRGYAAWIVGFRLFSFLALHHR